MMNSRLTTHYLLQVAVGFYMLSPSLRVTFAIDAPAGEHQGSYLSYVDTDFTTALREVQYVKPELQEHEHVDLWLIAGQSNAAGDNGYCNETMPPELEPLPPQVAFAWRFSDRQWFKACPNMCMVGMGGVYSKYVLASAGPELAFARTLLDAGASTKIGFIPHATGGFSIHKHYNVSGPEYAGMVQGVKEAYHSLNGRAVLRGVIFVQGEADATALAGLEAAKTWQPAFERFVHTLRRDLSGLYHSRLPIIMGIMSDRNRDRFLTHINIVRQQQLQLSMHDVIKVDTMAFEYFWQWWSGEAGVIQLHISKRGQVAMGKWMALEYLTWSGFLNATRQCASHLRHVNHTHHTPAPAGHG